MSNKQVPTVYRQIINQTVSGSRPEFEEAGIEEAVLKELQKVWEDKLAQTRVADFEQDARMAASARAANLAHAQAVASGSSARNGGAPAASSSPSGSSKAPRAAVKDDPDAVDSDLDDSDEEEKADEAGDSVIALWEKVNRVKNKWKVQLRDGIVHVNNKEYLFQKCQGEFEW